MSVPRQRDLFTEVVGASGAPSIIAPGTVRRALRDVGSNPQAASPNTYIEALPSIRARLRAFMSPDEAEQAAERIRQLVSTAKD